MSDKSGRARGAVIVGASSGVGRSLASTLAADGWSLVIAARSADDLDVIASDLATRHGVSVTPLVVDLMWDSRRLGEFVDRSTGLLPRLDAVLIPAGAVADIDEGTNDAETTARMVQTNMLGVMVVAGRVIAKMEQAGFGTVVVCSSIAAAVPRDRNVAYAAAKAGLESFGRSMRHRLANSRVAVQVYALGYVDTALSRGQQLRLPPASPDAVARTIVAGLDTGSFQRYEPRYWGAIVRVMRALPWFVYRRLKF
jgi:decaprenylphospho-beta-D-erythro-pentofuranosid-2-ulose 2-reductase